MGARVREYEGMRARDGREGGVRLADYRTKMVIVADGWEKAKM